ncbi:MAG: TRAP C4-dicarboxylate ABC transporter permease [Cycloclasticus sp. symbiont of Poecilosclerida sp. N]|nr:MAG: TRAP C4-dicarboxylate ABC transporter permease [Cycloclasticus sp. symbiont of Poecilosclerida sp. N]
MLKKLSLFIDAFNQRISNTVAWLTVLMVIIMFAIVVLRYGFNIGSIAAQESITYMHGLVFMLAIAHTLKIDGHVRVDILYHRLGPEGKAIVNLIGSLLLLLPVCAVVIVISWDYVSTSWSYYEGSREAGGIDGVFLIKSLIPLMAGLLFLQGISEVLKSILTLKGQR